MLHFYSNCDNLGQLLANLSAWMKPDLLQCLLWHRGLTKGLFVSGWVMGVH